MIASGLVVAGVQLLSTTTDIVELLLNGVAIAYIMDIDELTYHVLVPAKVRTMITTMNPLKTKWTMNVPVRSLVLSHHGDFGADVNKSRSPRGGGCHRIVHRIAVVASARRMVNDSVKCPQFHFLWIPKRWPETQMQHCRQPTT